MAIFVYINILLRFLVPLVYIKRNRQDLTNEENASNEDSNKETMEELEDMNRIKSKIKDLKDRGVIDRVEEGLPVPVKDFKELENIRKEFDSYFDKESGNTLKEGLDEVIDYLDDEIIGITESIQPESTSTSEEDSSKKRKIDNSIDDDLPVEMPSIFDDVD
jgi:hypothetical protein